MLKNKEKIKYFAYLRKSTEDDGRQAQSITDQESALKKITEREKLDVAEEWFKEEKSAKKPNNRPEFSEMIKRIKAGEANGILCWKLNRLSRNPLESGIIQQLLHDGLLISIQTYDKEYTIEDNDILFGVETNSASQFIKDLRNDVKRGLESKVKKGWFPCRAPIGYINNKFKEKGEKDISKDPERFPIIRNLWQSMLTGRYSPSQIQRIANNEYGFRTLKFRKEGGDKLGLSTIYKLLTNPFYAGLFSYGEHKFVQGKHQSMVTIEEYDRVQKLLGKKGHPGPKVRQFALTGLMKCGVCGGAITAEVKTKINKKTNKIKEYVYYHCTRRIKGVKCNQRIVISLDNLEAQFETEINKVTILPEFLELALKKLSNIYENRHKERESIYNSISNALKEAKSQLHELIRMRFKKLIGDEQFKTEKQELEVEIKGLEGKLENSSEKEKELVRDTEIYFDFITYSHYWFLNGTLEDKKKIAHALGSNFLLTDNKLTLESSSWFIPVKNGYPQIEAKYIRFELHKTPESERTDEQKAAFEEIKNEWSGRRESNPQQKLGRLWFYH